LKLLVDENLPPRLVHDLADLFPGSAHVGPLGLGSTPDTLIWEYAKAHGFVFLTKDKDFASLSLVSGAPPKVILLQTGNCTTVRLLGLLRSNAIRLADFENDARRGLLILW
jgi:predicted nuclease of predicted toxin-antitoxin system